MFRSFFQSFSRRHLREEAAGGMRKRNLYLFSLIQSEPYLPGPLDFSWESVVGLVPWEMLSRIPVSAWIFFIRK
jgi:hypothetical protein